MELHIPTKMKSFIDNKPYIIDDIGMSGNQVLIFEDMVLKIEEWTESVERQVQMMQWLEGKIPVPKVLAFEVENEKSYLLMSKVSGAMSCDTYYLEHPQILLKALATGLKMLWQVDVSECPVVRDVDAVLMDARLQIENGWKTIVLYLSQCFPMEIFVFQMSFWQMVRSRDSSI